MTLGDLIARYRADSFDKKNPPLCSDAEVTAFANEAVHEACRRAKLLRDDTTANDGAPSPLPVCEASVTSGQQTITFSEKVIRVDSMWLVDAAGVVYPLLDATVQQMDAAYTQWRSVTGVPSLLVQLKGRKARFYPVPLQAYTLRAIVDRLPLASEDLVVSNLNGVPVIDAEYHVDLVQWILYRAYKKRDRDFDGTPSEAKRAYDLFERAFGRSDPFTEEFFRRYESTILDYAPLA